MDVYSDIILLLSQTINDGKNEIDFSAIESLLQDDFQDECFEDKEYKSMRCSEYFEKFIESINKEPSYTDADYLHFFEQITNENDKIKEKIIDDNLGLVYQIAKKYAQNSNLDFLTIEDLFQKGYLSLVKAIDSFDITRSKHFIWFLNLTINRDLFKYINKYEPKAYKKNREKKLKLKLLEQIKLIEEEVKYYCEEMEKHNLGFCIDYSNFATDIMSYVIKYKSETMNDSIPLATNEIVEDYYIEESDFSEKIIDKILLEERLDIIYEALKSLFDEERKHPLSAFSYDEARLIFYELFMKIPHTSITKLAETFNTSKQNLASFIRRMLTRINTYLYEYGYITYDDFIQNNPSKRKSGNFYINQKIR